MPKLTETQKNFIFEHFFKDDRFAGARNIMESLLEDGSCIVPNYNNGKPIWTNGISHFIKIEDVPNGVGCVKYIFNYKEFINSANFGNRLNYEVDKFVEEIKKMQIHVDDLNSIPKE